LRSFIWNVWYVLLVRSLDIFSYLRRYTAEILATDNERLARLFGGEAKATMEGVRVLELGGPSHHYTPFASSVFPTFSVLGHTHSLGHEGPTDLPAVAIFDSRRQQCALDLPWNET
jgi:hypothetical protein